MRIRSGGLAVFAIAVLLVSSVPALSQVTAAQAQLNGSVRDPSGGVVVKATVTLRNVDTNHVYTTSSNEAGYYIFTNLPPGNYELSASSRAFPNTGKPGLR